MEDIIMETISDEAIAGFSRAHEESRSKGGEAEVTARFQFAHSLIKSRHTQDVKHGINMMENLYYDGDQSSRRDYLYYIAVGHTRLKKYQLALECVDHFLRFEPDNDQAKRLRSYIKDKLTKDGLLGMAITAGSAVVIGGLLGLGLSLAKNSR